MINNHKSFINYRLNLLTFRLKKLYSFKNLKLVSLSS